MFLIATFCLLELSKITAIILWRSKSFDIHGVMLASSRSTPEKHRAWRQRLWQAPSSLYLNPPIPSHPPS